MLYDTYTELESTTSPHSFCEQDERDGDAAEAEGSQGLSSLFADPMCVWMCARAGLTCECRRACMRAWLRTLLVELYGGCGKVCLAAKVIEGQWHTTACLFNYCRTVTPISEQVASVPQKCIKQRQLRDCAHVLLHSCRL